MPACGILGWLSPASPFPAPLAQRCRPAPRPSTCRWCNTSQSSICGYPAPASPLTAAGLWTVSRGSGTAASIHAATAECNVWHAVPAAGVRPAGTRAGRLAGRWRSTWLPLPSCRAVCSMACEGPRPHPCRQPRHCLSTLSVPPTLPPPLFPVFHLSEANGEKIRNPKKLQSIKQASWRRHCCRACGGMLLQPSRLGSGLSLWSTHLMLDCGGKGGGGGPVGPAPPFCPPSGQLRLPPGGVVGGGDGARRGDPKRTTTE